MRTDVRGRHSPSQACTYSCVLFRSRRASRNGVCSCSATTAVGLNPPPQESTPNAKTHLHGTTCGTTNIGTADPPASGPALPQKSGTGLLIATRQRAADREKSSASGTCISGVPTSVHWRRPPPPSRNTSRKRNRPPKTSNWGCTPMIWGCGTCGTRGSVQSGWDAILAAAGGADDLPRPRRHGKPTVYPLPVRQSHIAKAPPQHNDPSIWVGCRLRSFRPCAKTTRFPKVWRHRAAALGALPVRREASAANMVPSGLLRAGSEC